MCELSRYVDPSYAARCLTEEHIDDFVSTILPLSHHVDATELKKELPDYLAAAQDVTINHDDVSAFSEQVLAFWKSASKKKLAHWRKAARILFCMSPNSASCERVFALLNAMFGEGRSSSLADLLQAALMLRYNGRNVMEH